MSDPVYIGYYTLDNALSMPNDARFLMYDPAGPGSYNITGALLKSQILASPVVTGQMTVPAGSASAPSMSTAGDTNTGIYFPAADTVGIATAGVERIKIDGTALTYSAVGSNNAQIRASASGTGIAGLYLDASNGDFAGGDYFWLRQNDDLTTEITQAGAYDLLFKTSNTERFRILSTGALIGATCMKLVGVDSTSTSVSTDTTDGSDTKRLQLAGGGAPGVTRGAYINIHGNEHASFAGVLSLLSGNTGTDYINFFTGNAAERARITASGNILIGQTTDDGANRLQVTSSGKTGAVFIDSTAYAAGVGGGIKFAGKYDATNSATFAGIQGEKENSTSGNYAGALVFLSRAHGEGTSERARLTSAGNLLIGTASGLSLAAKVQVKVTDGTYAAEFGDALTGGVIGIKPDAANGNEIRWGGTGTNANVLRFVGSSSVERARITSTGAVLINTTSATSTDKLEVKGNVLVKDTANITTVRCETGLSTGYSSFDTANDSTSLGVFRTYGSAHASLLWGTSIANSTFIGNNGAACTNLFIGTIASAPILLGTGNAERARITSAGTLIVGRTSNSSGLTGYHEIAGNTVFSNTTTTTNAIGGRVWAKNICTTDMVDGFGPAYVFSIEDNAGVHNNIAHISGVRSGADNSGSLIFTTYNAGAAVEKARITSTGELLVGRTSGTSVPKLQVGFANPAASPAYTINVDVAVFNALSAAVLQVQGPTSSGIGFSSDTVRSAGYIGYTHSTDLMEFRTSTTAKMYLNSNGTLLIGGSTSYASTMGMEVSASGADTARLHRPISSNSAAAGRLMFTGLDSASNIQPYGSIGAVIEYGTDGAETGSVAIQTATAGTLTEKFRVNSAGEVLIGTSSQIIAGYQIQTNAENNGVAGTYLRNGNTGTAANTRIGLGSSNDVFQFIKYGSGYTGRANEAHIYNGTGDIYFSTNAGNERLRITQGGNVELRSAALLGYGTGSGGTVTQATSRTTGVTINKPTGSITLVSAAGSATWQSFTVTNSLVAATDVPKVVQKSGTDKYMIFVTNVAAGSFQVTFATTGGTTTEQPVFNFAIIKGVTS